MDREAMISVVIPVYNEEANLPHLFERLRSAMEKTGKSYEIIFVDDGSRDNTLSILKSFLINPGVKVVELTRNYGQHAAIFSGFSVVRGDIVITLDADLQNPPEEISNLIRVMEEGDYDVVGTIRRERKDSFLRTIPLPHDQRDHTEDHQGEYVRLGLYASGLPEEYCGTDGELS